MSTLTVILMYDRGMFFEGVFDNLEGMTALPHRPMSEFKVRDACFCYDLANEYHFQPYIPHIAMMSAWGLTESESVFCSVSKSDGVQTDFRSQCVCQGKIKRTRPFYTKQFEFLKSVVAAEVFVALRRPDTSRILCLGCQEHKNHHVLSFLDAPASRVRPDLRPVRL
jgi:hypothetical protein